MGNGCVMSTVFPNALAPQKPLTKTLFIYMELKNQVTNLELSKKLKELGVKQESLFWWNKFENDQADPIWDISRSAKEEVFGIDVKENVSAFTVAELGVLLPRVILVEQKVYNYQQLFAINEAYYIQYYDFDRRIGHYHVRDYSEANARAKMLIYLLENDLIKL